MILLFLYSKPLGDSPLPREQNLMSLGRTSRPFMIQPLSPILPQTPPSFYIPTICIYSGSLSTANSLTLPHCWGLHRQKQVAESACTCISGTQSIQKEGLVEKGLYERLCLWSTPRIMPKVLADLCTCILQTEHPSSSSEATITMTVEDVLLSPFPKPACPVCPPINNLSSGKKASLPGVDGIQGSAIVLCGILGERVWPPGRTCPGPTLPYYF